MSRPKAGRPALYQTPEQLRAAVDRYFESCAGVPVFTPDGLPVLTKTGAQKMAGEIPPTISGLSLALGFKDRHTFTEQRKRGAAFLEIVQYARLRCEAYTEARLYDPDSFRGAAFVLHSCFGWGRAADPAALPEVHVIVKPAADPDGGSALTVAAGQDPERGSGRPAEDPAPGLKPAHTVRIDMMN